MCNVPTIDMTGTGRNIVKLRQNAGFSVKDLQDIIAVNICSTVGISA